MRKRKSRITTPVALPPADPKSFVSGPKLRAMFGISAPTLWRWRHDRKLGFPKAKEINGRLYFQWGAVCTWFAKQPNARQIAAAVVVLMAGAAIALADGSVVSAVAMSNSPHRNEVSRNSIGAGGTRVPPVSFAPGVAVRHRWRIFHGAVAA
jgi:predicted DNA-binding transcriptional regulator AlpA